MIANQNGCRYGVCGLNNVRLVGYPLGRTPRGITVVKIDILHQIIAEAVCRRPGPLVGAEVCFLRTQLGYTPEQLGNLIDQPTDHIRVVELGRRHLDVESDIELRRLIFSYYETPAPSLDYLRDLYRLGQVGEHVIRIVANDTQNFWALDVA